MRKARSLGFGAAIPATYVVACGTAVLAGCAGLLGDFSSGQGDGGTAAGGDGGNPASNDGGKTPASDGSGPMAEAGSGGDGGGGTHDDGGPGNDGMAPPADVAVPEDAGIDASPACPSGDIECADACVPANNPQTCGSCSNVCPSTTPACGPIDGGGYACNTNCPGTEANCGGACADLTSDPNHCGACTTQCAGATNATATCTGAPPTCGFQCNSNYHLCSGACVDSTSPSTCGASCTACTAPSGATPTCVAQGTSYACSFACTTGTHACNGACVDDSDVDNCGSSCTPCTGPANATATCVPSGNDYACSFTCNAEYHPCGNTCAYDSDPATCGSSCTACVPPANAVATCTGSPLACGSQCQTGFTQCASGCTMVASDPQNCGVCGHACPSGTCSSSTCVPELLASSSSEALQVAVDPNAVYWVTYAPVGTNQGTVSLYSAPLGMGAPATSLFSTTQTNAYPSNPVLGAGGTVGDAFLSVGNALSVYEIPKMSGTAKAILGPNVTVPDEIAFDPINDYLYVPEQTKVTRTNGTTTVSAITANLATAAYVYVDANYTYVAEYNPYTVSFAPLNSTNATSTTMIATGVLQGFNQAYADGTYFWVTDSGTKATGGIVYRCAAPSACTAANIFISGQTAVPVYVVSDGTNVYWSSSAGIDKCPVSGCPAGVPTPWVIGYDPLGLTFDAKNLYFTSGTSVYVVPK